MNENKNTAMPSDGDITEKLKKCQLGILKEIDRVCRKHSLTYCLAFGSCLGAVRHGGFIPWDDDIDVYMPISDFEKLVTLKEEFNAPYFLQTTKTDAEYGLMIGRVRNSDTTLIEKSEADRDINHGVFADIYPLYGVGDSGKIGKKTLLASMMLRLLVYGRAPQNRGTLMRVGSAVLLFLIKGKLREKIISKCAGALREEDSSAYLSTLYGDESHIAYPREMLFPPKAAEFSALDTFIPADHDKYLKLTYGDYMILPPEEKRRVHHDFYFADLEHGYAGYKGSKYCT